MSKSVTDKSALLAAFPYSVMRDKNKGKLADVTAEELVKAVMLTDLVSVFPEIDKLPEAVLDILAADLMISWYQPDAPVENKRSQIKSSFKLHRQSGTKEALITALSDVFPGTEIKEWFEYGGEPFHFALILDVTRTCIAITQDTIEQIVNAVKPVRAVLESDSITYRVRNAILVSVKGSYALYDVRRCGTYPEMAEQGGISESQIDVSANTGRSYVRGKTNSPAGTYPAPTIKGGAADSYVSFATGGGSAAYSTRVCGLPFEAL